MKNLKRVLSLGLASVMLLGMMVMGASAATFSDSSEIKNTEAVNLMVALNIIKGKDTGAFDPNGNVTRGEMAKMITMILFGGEEPTLSTGTTPKFTDVTSHWARKYIEYCASQGIIAGLGDGTFAPDANVTGTAAAKMALTALGYDAQVYGFENNKDWELNINAVANRTENNLYRGLKGINPSATITRDEAAQILYNALSAKMVKPTYTVTSNGIETLYQLTNTSLLSDRYDCNTKYGIMTNISYVDGTYSYTFDSAAEKDEDKIKGVLESESDFSNLFGYRVEAIYQEDGTVLGIFATEGSVLLTGVMGTLSKVDLSGNTAAKSFKYNKVTYSLTKGADETPVVAFNEDFSSAAKNLDDIATGTELSDGSEIFTFELIDNDNDGKGDLVVIYPVVVTQITNVGKTTITLADAVKTNYKEKPAASKTATTKDLDIYDGFEKNDWVVVTEYDEDGIQAPAKFEKLEVISGNVTGLNETTKEFRIDGVWYKSAEGDLKDTAQTPAAIKRGTSYDVVVYNGYTISTLVSEGEESTATVEQAVYTLDVKDPDNDGWTVSPDDATQAVSLLFADGTRKAVTVTEVDGERVQADKSVKAAGKTLYTYEVDEDGNYELFSITGKEAKFESDTTLTSSASHQFSIKTGKTTGGEVESAETKLNFRFNSDAVVFVKYTDSDDKQKVAVVKGDAIGDWAETATEAGSILYADENKNTGFIYATLGLIDLGDKNLPGSGKGKTTYGYLVADAIRVREDGKNYVELTIWNGEEEISLLVSDTDENFALKEQTAVKYTDNGTASSNKAEALKGDKGAVVGYAGGDDIDINSGDGTEANTTSYTMDKDTVIIFVDSENKDGAEGGEITLADHELDENEEEKDSYKLNVYLVADKEGVIEIIFVDVNNEITVANT